MTQVSKVFEQAGAAAKGLIEISPSVDLATAQQLSNKTLVAPILSGSVTGTYTLAGTPTITAPAISAPVITGAATIANGATLTTPYIAGATITGTVTVGNGCTLTTPAIAGATITGTVTIGNGCTLTTPAIAGATLTGAIVRTGQVRQIGVAAKVGGTAGWVVNAANNIYSWTVAASQTAATLVIPIVGLKVGDTITAFGISGFLTSGGGSVTLDASLRSQTAASGSLTDALVASMTQISASGNTLVSSAGNGAKTGLSTVIANDVGLYLLLTATTAAGCTVGLSNAVTITVTEA
jgi:hypothetical protein